MRQHFQTLRSGSNYACGSDEFREDFLKYGVDDFELYILETDVLPSNGREREAYWIDEYQATNPCFGYNKDPMSIGFAVRITPGLPPKPGER